MAEDSETQLTAVLRQYPEQHGKGMWSASRELAGVAEGMMRINGPEDLVTFRNQQLEQMGLHLMWILMIT